MIIFINFISPRIFFSFSNQEGKNFKVVNSHLIETSKNPKNANLRVQKELHVMKKWMSVSESGTLKFLVSSIVKVFCCWLYKKIKNHKPYSEVKTLKEFRSLDNFFFLIPKISVRIFCASSSQRTNHFRIALHSESSIYFLSEEVFRKCYYG